jgi:hypothetical protein
MRLANDFIRNVNNINDYPSVAAFVCGTGDPSYVQLMSLAGRSQSSLDEAARCHQCLAESPREFQPFGLS